jgi:hypothetical protein
MESAFFLCVILHGASPVDQWSSRLHRRDAATQAFAAALHQSHGLITGCFNGIRPGRIAHPPAKKHANIHGQNIARFEWFGRCEMLAMNNASIQRKARMAAKGGMPLHGIVQERAATLQIFQRICDESVNLCQGLPHAQKLYQPLMRANNPLRCGVRGLYFLNSGDDHGVMIA